MAIYLQGVGTSSFKVTVAGVDLTDHCKSATVNMEADDVDITAMGATAHAHALGLRDDSIALEFYQDFAASSVDQTMYALLGVSAGGTVVVSTSGTTVSTTNPKYTLVGLMNPYTPIDAGVGDASMMKVKFVPAAGSSITRATS